MTSSERLDCHYRMLIILFVPNILFVRHGDVSFEIHAQGDLQVGGKQRKRQSGSGSKTLPISINKVALPFDHLLTCPNPFDDPTNQTGMVQLEYTGQLVVNANFTITVNMMSVGTMVPPSITSLSFSARMWRFIRVQ